MPCNIKLHPDNSLTISAILTNPKNVPPYINDAATVEVTIYDMTGAEIPDKPWPLALSYVEGSDGLYQAIVTPLTTIKAGKQYKIALHVLGSDGITGYWEFHSKAIVRNEDPL